LFKTILRLNDHINVLNVEDIHPHLRCSSPKLYKTTFQSTSTTQVMKMIYVAFNDIYYKRWEMKYIMRALKYKSTRFLKVAVVNMRSRGATRHGIYAGILQGVAFGRSQKGRPKSEGVVGGNFAEKREIKYRCRYSPWRGQNPQSSRVNRLSPRT
jgi:hypothetical protein